jgi:hypothetical protein
MKVLLGLMIVSIGQASTVFQLDGTSFYSPDLVVTSLNSSQKLWPPTELTPFTYLSFSELTISTVTVQSTLTEFLSKDDVFSEAFLSTAVLGGSYSLSLDATSPRWAVTRSTRQLLSR